MSRRRAQTQVEYGLLLALLAVVAIAILGVVGRRNRDAFTTVQQRLVTTEDGSGGERGPVGHW